MFDSSSKTTHDAFRHHFVQCERNGEVEVIAVNRPQESNSLNPATLHQLHASVARAIEDPVVRGIVISATSPGFVMGADLNYLVKSITQEHFDKIHYYTDLGNNCFDLIAQSPKPVVAAVNGPAMGGGFELALACHYRVAVPGANFSLPETGLGISPLWGGPIRLERLLGTGLAKWLTYTGKNISSQDAYSLNLVEAIVPPDQLLTIAATKAVQPDWQISQAERRSLETSGVEQVFSTNDVERIFYGQFPGGINDPVAMAAKQLKKRSLIALKFTESIFARAGAFTPAERSQLYRDIVEVLYRSEDTMTGLTWKQQKKIGTAVFSAPAP